MKIAVLHGARQYIVLDAQEIHSEGQLVLPADDVDVIGKLVDVAIEIRRRAGPAADVKRAAHLHAQIGGRKHEHVDAQVRRADSGRRRPAVVGQPGKCCMERVHGGGTKGIGVAESNALTTFQIAGAGGDQNVVRIKHGRVPVIRDKVPPEDGVLFATHEVDTADELVLVSGSRNTVGHSPARVAGRRQITYQFDRGRVVTRHRHLIVGEQLSRQRIFQSFRFAVGLARRRLQCAPVARQCGSGRHETDRAGWILTIPGALIPEKEEQLVLDDLIADRAAVLITLEGIVRGGEEVACIHVPIADKLEEIAVPLVGTRLSDDVDDTAGVEAIARGKAAGFNAELLQGVGERERQVDVGVSIDILAAIQQIVGLIALPAGDRHGGGRLIILAAGQVACRGGSRGAGNQNQLRGLPAVQREFGNPALLDHLRHGVFLGFHHGGAGGYLDALGNRTYLQRNIDLHRVVNLQNDAALDIGFEALRRNLQQVWTDRQIRQRVRALRIRSDGADKLRLGLRDLDLGAGHNRARPIGYTTVDFGHRNGLSAQA